MKESQFNATFRKNLGQLGVHIYRVESHSSCPGIPDNHYLIEPNGMTGWIEMKVCPTMPRKVAYRPAQAPWLALYTLRGGRAWTALYVEDTMELLMFSGDQAPLAAMALFKVDCLHFLVQESTWPLVKALLSSTPQPRSEDWLEQLRRLRG